MPLSLIKNGSSLSSDSRNLTTFLKAPQYRIRQAQSYKTILDITATVY